MTASPDLTTAWSRRRRSAALAITLVFSLFAPSAGAQSAAEPSAAELIESLLAGRDPVGGPFELIDHRGRPRTDADFRGKLLVLYFGYTSCPDVCPTELQSISLALDSLGPAAASLVQTLFISIDPERDTPQRLADFVSSFHPQFVGLTGSPAAIRRTAIAYKVFFARHPGTSNYPVDHTGFVYLVGRDGRYLGFLEPGRSPAEIAAALRAQLGAAVN